MKRLLENHIFDANLRYESHTLFYKTPQGMETLLEGIMGAAILGTLLAETEEGDRRGIALDTPEQRNSFFERYEREVRRDNGGLFSTELEALSQAYMELMDTDILLRICRNDRLYDLALGLVMEYMQRLVREQVGDHIYDLVPWHMPFAQWLYDAGFAETQRQHLLSINWGDPAEVYALAQTLKNSDDTPRTPTFYFQSENARLLMEKYFCWLSDQVQAEAAMMPDAKSELAQLKPFALAQETNWDFLKPELKNLEPEDLNLYRQWMKQWTEFITSKWSDNPESTFPEQVKTPKFEQVLFPDTILPCPPANNYVKVCEYIKERCRYDEAFNTYYKTRTRVKLCQQLTAIFGWYVDPGFLGSRINYHKNRRK